MARITVTCNRTVAHSGELYSPGCEITDEEDRLQSALDSGAVTKKESTKSTKSTKPDDK